MNMLSNERGVGRFKVFLFFALLFLVIHVAVKLVPMYMDASRMEDEMRMKAGVSQVLKDEEILIDLVKKARELDLPLTKESFVISRDNDKRRMMIRTTTGWDVEVHFLGDVYVRTYHFDPVVEESFMNVIR
jgi:hypothetical protein